MIIIVIAQKSCTPAGDRLPNWAASEPFLLAGLGTGKGSRSRHGTWLGRRGNASGRATLLNDLGETTILGTQMAATSLGDKNFL
jgi:hypothetical protein